ncbi:MAG: CapA family protein [Coriobacteriales bacterium]|nr:CapA family protein [Coriobacteriales bacterium]
MSDLNNKSNASNGEQRIFANHYSRSRGVASYRQRRRVNRITKVSVWIVLVLIVGGAAILFGRQVFYALTHSAGSTTSTESKASGHEEVAITTVQPASVSLMAAGDVVANGSVVESGRKADGNAYNFVHLFSNITDELDGFDLCLVNQETPLAGSEHGFGGTDQLNAPQDLGRAEVATGFNVILHANDHALDWGQDGVHNELSWWHVEQPNLPILGVAEPDPVKNPGLSDYVGDVYTYTKDGFKVAVLNHSAGIGADDRSVVSPLDEAKVREDVSRARDLGAEVIVACPHWGDENSAEITDEQREFAELYAKLGVDVILGTHPRVLQGVEVLDGEAGHKTLCYYSLGCLVSALYSPDNYLGGLAEFTIDRSDNGTYTIKDAKLRPVVTHRANGDAYGVYLLADYTNEIARTGWDGYTYNRDFYDQRCLEVLGDDYDTDAGELSIEV